MTNKNILIVTQYFYPENFGINEVAARWVKDGNRVEVVTGLPNYPEGEIYQGFETKYEETYRGVLIHRTKCRPRHKGSWNLFRNYMDFMVKAKKTVRKRVVNQVDYVFCYMPSPIFQLGPAILAKKIFKCPLVLMCCDQWPESLKIRGLSSGPFFWWIANYCRRSLKKCDFVLNVAPSFIEYNNIVNRVPIEKMDWCLQHCDDAFDGARTYKKDSSTIDLMFAGNIGLAQNVDDIVKAYSELRYENLLIHVFGDGSCLESCKRLSKELKVENNVLFYGRVSSQTLNDFYPKVDACILTLSHKTAIGNTIPSKLSGYMSAGKTIIAAVSGDASNIIKNANCGICVEPDDYKELSKAFREFYEHKNEYKECGSNARTFFEKNCTINHFINKTYAIFERLSK